MPPKTRRRLDTARDHTGIHRSEEIVVQARKNAIAIRGEVRDEGVKRPEPRPTRGLDGVVLEVAEGVPSNGIRILVVHSATRPVRVDDALEARKRRWREVYVHRNGVA